MRFDIDAIGARVRSSREVPAHEFRRRLLRYAIPLGGCVALNAAIGASSLGRTGRAIASAPVGLGATVFGLGVAVLLLGRYVRVSPQRFRVIAGVSAVLLALIIVTGAAVRLTGSGLGCPDWPSCDSQQFVSFSNGHRSIEQGNRLVTILCVAVAAIGVLAALVRTPMRRDLVQLGLIVSALLFGNAIVGGAVVLFHLKTLVVMAHFLLAIASLTVGLLLLFRSGEPGPGGDVWGRDRRPMVSSRTFVLSRLVTGLALIGLVLGTVTSGSGPHSGDPKKTERLPFGVEQTAKVHSAAMWLLLASVVALAVLVARERGDVAELARRRLSWLMAAIVAQGGLGYLQYAKRLPAGLVELHVVGATVVWTLLVWVRITLTVPAGSGR